MPQRRGCGGENWGLLGESTGETIRSKRGVIDTETVVPARVRAVDTPLPYRFGEGVERLRVDVPEIRPTSPWRERTNSRHSFRHL